MSFLAALSNPATRSKLKPTQTKITRKKLDGSGYVTSIEIKRADGSFVESGQQSVEGPTHLVKSESHVLKAQVYDAALSKWRAVTTVDTTTTTTTTTTAAIEQKLTLVTYNVWFAREAFEERTANLLACLEAENADVVCLQEVTDRLLRLLKSSVYMQKTYRLSDVTGASVSPYGVLMCVKSHTITHFTLHKLPTKMARKVLTVDWPVHNSKRRTDSMTDSEQQGQEEAEDDCVRIATVHLESMGYPAVRCQQMKLIFQTILNTAPFAVFCGDFNFSPHQKEQLSLPEDYTDTYAALNMTQAEREAKHTIPKHSTCKPNERLDRVLVKTESDTQHFSCTAIHRLGLHSYISDHKGLSARFSMLAVATAAVKKKASAKKKNRVSFSS